MVAITTLKIQELWIISAIIIKKLVEITIYISELKLNYFTDKEVP